MSSDPAIARRKSIGAIFVALAIPALLIGVQFQPVLGNHTISTGWGTESFSEHFGWPLRVATRSVDRTFDPRDYIGTKAGASEYKILTETMKWYEWNIVYNVMSIVVLTAVTYFLFSCVARVSSEVFLNSAVLLTLIPFVTLLLFHPQVSINQFLPNSVKEFIHIHSPNVKTSLHNALDIANELNHFVVNPEHILLGLLRLDSDPAVDEIRAITDLSIDTLRNILVDCSKIDMHCGTRQLRIDE